ncbi:hypothetical protein CLAFUW4_06224 [Fulvia fulva]|uniref:BTB domain-containing protein n=1 Tax=Passalora fulva TaxID=5499 RepID=A0A9Q8LIY1_PASFU|nr:uncharacterized protein CLAFUR5_06367 [Fulvia fulva]KAK4624533.1 hypothetical protein CLAFUR4_06227 [Fulvia fulva]KAK4626034.1 hypothetical protein CLAFUR0_06231 [Fulvia fulva]UJO18251.1 hypothetical protein CLAFUR5_06367 [Fulvia fulva]WPV14917.1 hypothetical protein CLAFUW4_06224 [Fulvia fulva]WPV30509.1 hypothetical protein CLAFUW7_06220 [Fulvia fulva]
MPKLSSITALFHCASRIIFRKPPMDTETPQPPDPVMAPPSTPDRSPSGSEIFGAVIDVVVGSNNTTRTFTVHQGVLCFYSGYFKTTLSAEASEGAIKLPNEDPAIFDTFSLWLYTRRFVNPVGEDDVTRLGIKKLTILWLFAEKHQIPLLQNEVLNFIHKKLGAERHSLVTDLQYLYEHTKPDSPLRLYYIQALVRRGSASMALAPDKLSRWPRAALVDVMRTTWGTDSGNCTHAKFLAWDLCKYHVHEEGVKCKKDDRKR